MTPLPKKKHAKARTRKRKASISFKIPRLVTCPKCQGLKFPHQTCSNCGFYKEGVELSTKKKNETKKRS